MLSWSNGVLYLSLIFSSHQGMCLLVGLVQCWLCAYLGVMIMMYASVCGGMAFSWQIKRISWMGSQVRQLRLDTSLKDFFSFPPWLQAPFHDMSFRITIVQYFCIWLAVSPL